MSCKRLGRFSRTVRREIAATARLVTQRDVIEAAIGVAGLVGFYLYCRHEFRAVDQITPPAIRSVERPAPTPKEPLMQQRKF